MTVTDAYGSVEHNGSEVASTPEPTAVINIITKEPDTDEPQHDNDPAPHLPFGQPVRVLESPAKPAKPDWLVQAEEILADKDALRAFRELRIMLTYCRKHASKSEEKFIKRFIRPLRVKRDTFGNRYKMIMDTDENGGPIPPTIMWSAHTDSVHRFGGMQEVKVRAHFAELAKGSTSNCLGADNAAGVWMLREMILAKIPGLYVFHRLEESGAQGAKHFVAHHKAILDGIECAIAFDRKDTKSIITKQRGSRTCSDEFAKSLATAIGMGHKPDPTGMYTDTAEYAGVVAECTNVSIGYSWAHTSFEELDLLYCMQLRRAMLKADLSNLEIKRDPLAPEEPAWKGYTPRHYQGEGGDWDGWDGYHGGYHGYGHVRPTHAPWQHSKFNADSDAYKKDPDYVWDTNQWRRRRPHEYQETASYKVKDRIPTVEPSKKCASATGVPPAAAGNGKHLKSVRGFLSDHQDYEPRNLENVVSLIQRWPGAVWDFLEQNGIDEQRLRDHIDELLDHEAGITG